MNIWLINPYGPIPGEGWRDYRFTMLGEELSRRGHSVIWWTGNFSHHFKRFRSKAWQDREVAPGFVIRLVPATSYSRNIGIGRIRFEVAYTWRMYHRAYDTPAPEAIIGTDPPQIVGYTCVKLARHFNVPLVLDVFDLWPELFVLAFPRRLRRLAPTVLAPLFCLRKKNLRGADAIVALCDSYLAEARRQVPGLAAERTLTAFNGIDVKAFRDLLPDARQAAILACQRGKQVGDVYTIFAGSLGNNYDILTILQSATCLNQRKSRVKILIAGEGPLRPLVVEFITSQHLPNLIYLGKLDHRELIQVYGICDIGLCAYGPDSNVAMPDKAYDYMAAGLPIINSLKGELAALLETEQIGIQYDAGNPESLARALESLEINDGSRREMAGRAAILGMRFDRYSQYRKYADLVEVIAAGTCPAGSTLIKRR